MEYDDGLYRLFGVLYSVCCTEYGVGIYYGQIFDSLFRFEEFDHQKIFN